MNAQVFQNRTILPYYINNGFWLDEVVYYKTERCKGEIDNIRNCVKMSIIDVQFVTFPKKRSEFAALIIYPIPQFNHFRPNQFSSTHVFWKKCISAIFPNAFDSSLAV